MHLYIKVLFSRESLDFHSKSHDICRSFKLNDLQIPFITEEIKRYSTIYYNRLKGHESSYVTELSNPLNVRRRLKRQWPSDLKDQKEEEE
jgi:hypothetical protein